MRRSSTAPAPDPDLSELRMLREELQLRLHLTNKETARQWRKLDEQLASFEQALDKADNGVREAGLSFALEVARTFNDLMRSNNAHTASETPVHQAMRTRVKTCSSEDTLARAAQVMWEKDIGCLAVVDAQQKVLGMVTDRDICMGAFVQWVHLSESTVSTVMSNTLHTCSPDDSLRKAMESMAAHQVRRLPVVDAQGVLVGMITLGDIARYSRMHTSRDADPGGESQVSNVYTAICEPRFRSIPPPPPSRR